MEEQEELRRRHAAISHRPRTVWDWGGEAVREDGTSLALTVPGTDRCFPVIVSSHAAS